ncbi:ParB/RepB/Spo0J family partition protein [bacterium]|nr:ParB/RepB/Spo0J family partition protein [bacterium]
MAKEKKLRLGRDPLDWVKPTVLEGKKEDELREIPVDKIVFDKNQPRVYGKDAEDLEIKELAESIKSVGLLEPITVCKLPDGNFLVRLGERRAKAYITTGKKKITAIIKGKDESREDVYLKQLIENIQRKNLNIYEVGIAYSKLSKDFNMKQDAIGKRVGKTKSAVNKYINISKLPNEIKEKCECAHISSFRLLDPIATAYNKNPNSVLKYLDSVIKLGKKVEKREDIETGLKKTRKKEEYKRERFMFNNEEVTVNVAIKQNLVNININRKKKEIDGVYLASILKKLSRKYGE